MVKRKTPAKMNSLNTSVPLVSWKDVTQIDPMEVTCTTNTVFSAFLRQPEGHFVHVFIKQPKSSSAQAARALRHEARSLLKLRGIHGIPHLYGVSRRPKMALFMAFTSGGLLGDFLKPQTPRSYLAGILRVCHIMREVHARGVAHKNLYPCHVFVEPSLQHDSNLVMVSLAGFSHTALHATALDKQYDVDSIATMALEVYEHIKPPHALYKRRELLLGAQRKDINLKNMEIIVTKVLYGRKPPQYP